MLGKEKRELLQSNMSELIEDQEEVKEEFGNTLTKIRKKYSFKEGELEETYDKVKADYNDLEQKK